MADKLAAEGFLVIAPALFDRAQRDVELGYTGDDVAAGRDLRGKVPDAGAMLDVEAAADALGGIPAGIVGYCYGGAMTWQAAGRLDGLSAASSYYGGGVAAAADLTPKCPTICHFGRKDAHIPADEVKATLQAAQPQVAVYIYEKSGHGFNNDGRPDSDPDDAALARKRTIELFEANGAA